MTKQADMFPELLPPAPVPAEVVPVKDDAVEQPVTASTSVDQDHDSGEDVHNPFADGAQVEALAPVAELGPRDPFAEALKASQPRDEAVVDAAVWEQEQGTMTDTED